MIRNDKRQEKITKDNRRWYIILVWLGNLDWEFVINKVIIRLI